MPKSSLSFASILSLCLVLAPVATIAAASDDASFTVKLSSVGDSKVEGTAEISQMLTIPEKPPAVAISITLEGAFIPEDTWPVEVHAGSCGHTKPATSFALEPAVEGKSETHLENLTVKKLLAPPRFSIEVRNPKDTAVVACGFVDVPRE